MTSKYRGFTIGELIVVIVIACVMLGLLAVYLNRSQIGARRDTCLSNMAQFATAAQLYEQSRGYYPGYCNQVGGRNASYLIALLPYIERMDLYRIWSDANATPDQLKTASVYLSLAVCPNNQPASMTGTPLSYVANSGRADLPASLKDPEKIAALLAASGVFQDRTATPAVDVSAKYVSEHDGLEYTLIFSENLLPAQSWIIPAPGDATTARKLNTFVWFATPPATSPASYRINANKAHMPQGVPANLEWSRPSSNHPGGVNVAFCDVHARFLDEHINYRVYKQLMTPDGAAAGDHDNSPLDDSGN